MCKQENSSALNRSEHCAWGGKGRPTPEPDLHTKRGCHDVVLGRVLGVSNKRLSPRFHKCSEQKRSDCRGEHPPVDAGARFSPKKSLTASSGARGGSRGRLISGSVTSSRVKLSKIHHQLWTEASDARAGLYFGRIIGRPISHSR